MTVVLIIILVLLIACIVASVFVVKAMTVPNVWDEAHEFEVLRDKWGYDAKPFYNRVEKKPFEYKTSRGYTLRGIIIPPEEGTSFPDGKQRAVLVVHGYTANRVTMTAFAESYHDLGFSIVIYEHRFHGESDKVFCSMGYYESKDCVEVAEYVRTLFPEDTIWGIQGESMGSATIMMAAPELPWMSFVSEDCGYATLRNEIADSVVFKSNLPPHPIAEFACVVFRIWRHIKPADVRPIDRVPLITQPMLFVHGGLDKFVPTENVYKLYEVKNGAKELKIFEDVPHAKSTFMHHDEYTEVLRSFLKKYNII